MTNPRHEAEVISRSNRPITRERLRDDLTALGVADGAVLLVHTALSAIGWVPGGAHTVLLALLDAVGHAGTLVFPTQSSHLSDPARWENPPVPTEWIATVRRELPAYDLDLTPSRGMGALPELARRHPDGVRSAHPLLSFVAIGRLAKQLMLPHELAPGLGDGSPLSRLEEADASTLLVGVDHGSCTALHLAEHRATWPSRSDIDVGAPLADASGSTAWRTWRDLELDPSDFATIGAAYIDDQRGTAGSVGLADSRLDSIADLVEFATKWISAHRT